MIRLRAAVLRGIAHPWLGPLLLLALAVLLALVLLHSSVDQVLHAGLACVVVAALLAAVARLAQPIVRERPPSPREPRAPPPPARPAAVLAVPALFSPLRL